MRWLMLMFIGVPIIEMVLLIRIGGMIGAIPTIGLVLLTAVVGVALLKQQGLSTIRTIQQKLEQGGMPGQELIEGAMLLIGGALLLTPGFVTDAIGFSLLIPTSRHLLAGLLLEKGILNNSKVFSYPPGDDRAGNSRADDARIIEGEFKQENDDPKLR